MSEAPETAPNTPKIPDFLIRAVVGGYLHPIVVQYLSLQTDLAMLPAHELAMRLEPWLKLSQAIAAAPMKSAGLDHPSAMAVAAGCLGVARAEAFIGFAQGLQRKVPELQNHLRLLAHFRSFADAAAKDRAEREAPAKALPVIRERSAERPRTKLIEPTAIEPTIVEPKLVDPPAPQAAAPSPKPPAPLPSTGPSTTGPSTGRALPRRSAPVKLWPGHTYVVRRQPGGK